MSARIILIEARPRRVADGVAETVRLAGGGADLPYFYYGQHWRAGIVKFPTVITALNFDGSDFGSGAVPQAAEIEWAPTRSADLAAMAGYFWPDAAITVRIGPEGADPSIALQGKVLDAPVQDGRLKLQLCDPAADLKKPLLTARYAGTGGLEGPAEWEGKIKRRVWGRVWNLAGEPIDKAYSIYAFADPGQPLQAFDAVRDKGAPAAALSTVAWQGSAGATLTALRAAAAPQGGGVVAPSIACVKWWTEPAGDLTADLRGEIGAAYVETAAEIVERLVQLRGGPAFAAGTVAGAKLLRSAPVGWIARDDATTAAAMIEELLGNSSLLWLLDSSGQIAIRPWTWGGSAGAAISQKVSRKSVFRPVATRKLGYRRNENTMARGDIAGIVFSDSVLNSDGSLITASVAAAAATATWDGIAGIAGQPTGTTVANAVNPSGGIAPWQVNQLAIIPDSITMTASGWVPDIGSATYGNLSVGTEYTLTSVVATGTGYVLNLSSSARFSLFTSAASTCSGILKLKRGSAIIASKPVSNATPASEIVEWFAAVLPDNPGAGVFTYSLVFHCTAKTGTAQLASVHNSIRVFEAAR